MKTRLIVFLSLMIFFACKKSDDSIEITPEPDKPTPEFIPSEVDYLIDSIHIEINPSGKVPLSANATLMTSEPVSYQYEVVGKYPKTKMEQALSVEHAVPINGLYADRENKVAIKVVDEAGNFQHDTISIVTEALPSLLPDIQIIRKPGSEVHKDFTFSMYEVIENGKSFSFPIIFDNEGEIRWYQNLKYVENLASPGEFLANGNLIFGFGPFICEFDLMGNEINRFVISGYHQHHDIYEMPNGNLLVAVTKNGLSSYNDFIIELDVTTGTILREWDLRLSLDPNRTAFTSSTSDWAHVNSVWYDEKRNNIVVSARTQGIFGLSMDNELQWILAPHKGWGLSGSGVDCNDFLLTAIDGYKNPYPAAIQAGEESASDFSWSYGQHSAEVLSNGDIIAFDNGDKRNFSNDVEYSRGVEFDIDIKNKTVRQVWQYGHDRGDDVFSRYEGDVDVVPGSTNRLICPAKLQNGNGSAASVIEVSYPDNRVLFEAYIGFPILIGKRGTGVYRSERISF